jgi:hypothetical protein
MVCDSPFARLTLIADDLVKQGRLKIPLFMLWPIKVGGGGSVGGWAGGRAGNLVDKAHSSSGETRAHTPKLAV